MTAVTDAAIAKVEAALPLDRLGDAARPVLVSLVGRGRRNDALTGRWLGHPFHPAAVLAPLGCWIGAALTDVVGGRGAERVARRLIGAGVVAAVPAAASGASDWLDTREAEQRVGTVHALLNGAAVAAMVTSWRLRRRGHRWAGIVVSTAGLGGALAAGLLGGHLAYGRGVGVSTTAFQSGPESWTPLIPVADLVRGRPVAAELDGVVFVAVATHDGALHVLENRCTHRGGPLAEGRVAGECIECPWHGSTFVVADGRVMAGPASVAQPAYDTRVVAGWVEICRSELGGLRRVARDT